jgi:hypothetical protein
MEWDLKKRGYGEGERREIGRGSLSTPVDENRIKRRISDNY